MGISMLGSIVGSILGGLASALGKGLSTIFGYLVEALMSILDPFINLLMKYLVAPIIALTVNLINYVLAILWYNISIFILGLIDYVQILFKLLAGLKVDGMQLNLSGSKSADSDLLLQLLLSDSIKNVFLSMCIVGIFLLVITTIFQIIKVEYTTEGAKNAKGPILNKAFRGLCNMIMIPALCICGVFIGNQVLDLLDTATKSNSESTISGQLFVAAASDAHYQSGDLPVYMGTSIPQLAVIQLTVNLIPITWNSVMEALGIENKVNLGDASNPWEENRDIDEIEENFSKRVSGYDYYNLANVSNYYDYSRINYLLLIFGGCILIKTLYFTCFGMIVRLYQCGMLFIISPAVIGMTPINEGGLGKWRSDFIGSAISAYGVVLAMNIYLILVKILLSIKFSFTSATDYFLGASLMEGLLKCIIVIGGAIYIEKFSGQIGGYFGAKDALAQGKDLEKGTKAAVKSVADGAVKAIGTGVQIAAMATGAGGAAVGAAKGLGAAMKLGGAAAKASGGSAFVGRLKGGVGYAQTGINRLADKPIEYMADSLGIERDSYDDRKRKKAIKKDQRTIDEFESQFSAQEARVQSAKVELGKAQASGDKVAIADAKLNLQAQEAGLTELQKQQPEIDKVKKDKEKNESEYAENSKIRNSQRMYRHESFREAGKAGWQEHTMGGQMYAGLKKQFGAWGDAAAKNGGDEIAGAQAHLKKVESKEAEDAAYDRNKRWIDQKNKGQEVNVKKLAVEEADIKNKQLDLTAKSGIANLNNLQERYDEAKTANNTAAMNALSQQMEATRARLADSLGLGAGDIVQDVNGKFEITGDYHVNTADLEKMFASIFNSKKGMNDKQAIEDAVKDAIQNKNAEQAKQIQEIFERVLQRYTKS